MPANSPLSPAADTSPIALLVIDMISCWDFPDAQDLVPGARRIAPAIAKLQARCRRAGVPVIFANDNHGRWRSDFRSQVDQALTSPAGALVTLEIRPQEGDYFILKPKHSAFFATPLELLLKDLGAKKIIVTGVSTDQCILATVADARMRGLAAHVPSDCTASMTPARQRRGLLQLTQAMAVSTRASTAIRLRRKR